ncbi:MAG: ABC transporter permease [Proteobacteria bacterium]|nr:ABC transporter permease [Pseudomonadota bacterium]
MARYIVRRLLASFVVLIIVALISFSIMQLVPGDPATVMAGVAAPPDQVQRIREQFGLDQPFPIQLARWTAGVVQGDLGQSIMLSRSVVRAIVERLPATLAMGSLAFALTLVLGVPAGIVAAWRQNTWVDQAIMAAAVIGVSVPSFWLGLIFIIFFAVIMDWLPAGGYVTFTEAPLDWFRSLVLPAIALSLSQVGLLARITRAAMVEVLCQDYIRTARAKGLPEWLVLARHAFANVLVQVITVIGIIFSLQLSGTVVIETVFSLPGLGKLLVNAILTRDYPLIQGGLLITASMFVLINLAVDVLYTAIDPRIRYE